MSYLDDKLIPPATPTPGRAKQTRKQLENSMFGFKIESFDAQGPTVIVRHGMTRDTRWRRCSDGRYEMEPKDVLE